MSDVKKLIIGIILVVIGMAMLLSSAGNIFPYIGALIGIVGVVVTVKTLVTGHF